MGDFLGSIYTALQPHLATIGWTSLTFALGTLAGFQLFVARYPQEYALAMRTLPAACYLVIRGLLPALLFVVLFNFKLLSLPPAGSAIVLGLGSEAFLRSRILLSFKSAGPNQLPSEASAGPLDFITWIQDFFLNRTGKVLTRGRMFIVGRWYGDCSLRFDEVCGRLENALPALGMEDAKERKDAEVLLVASKAEYDAEKAKLTPATVLPAEMERKCRLKLGYASYYALDRNSFHSISREITGH